MKVAKRINNNAVMCVDSKGRSVVAFGKGIAFAVEKETGELPLSAIERTFYNIDEHYLALLEELTPQVLAVAADIVEAADLEVPYELSNNAVLSMADHITFAIQRFNKGMNIQMPLAYDVSQMFPLEYKVGVYALKLIDKRLHVELFKQEAVGIALCILNASSAPEGAAETADQVSEDDALIDAITKIVERRYEIKIDPESFEYARFATHMRYLLGRIRAGEPLNSGNTDLYEAARQNSERGTVCLDEACTLLDQKFGVDITDEEKLYLLMHIMRMAHPRA